MTSPGRRVKYVLQIKKVGERSLCGFTLLYVVGPNRGVLPPPPHPVTKHDANNAHGSFLYQREERRAEGGDLAQVQTNDAYTVQEFTVVRSLRRLTTSRLNKNWS